MDSELRKAVRLAKLQKLKKELIDMVPEYMQDYVQKKIIQNIDDAIKEAQK